MSWVCEYCSTTNVDRDKKCLVCDKKRTRASVRKEKRIAREDEIARANALIYKYTTIAGKILCLSSIVLFSITALVVLYLKMQNGLIDDLIYNAIAIAENIIEQFKLMFNVNLSLIFAQFVHSPARYVIRNAKIILEPIVSVLYVNIRSITAELFVNQSFKYEILYEKIIIIANDIIMAFRFWGSLIATLLISAVENVVAVVYNAVEMFQKAKEPIVNLKNH